MELVAKVKGTDLSVIMRLSWCVVADTYSLYTNMFAMSQAFMIGSVSQAGDTDSSRAPVHTSGFEGS